MVTTAFSRREIDCYIAQDTLLADLLIWGRGYLCGLTRPICYGLIRARGDDMHKDILAFLAKITPEEDRLLNGSPTIDRDLYMMGTENTIYAEKLLSTGKLIDI